MYRPSSAWMRDLVCPVEPLAWHWGQWDRVATAQVRLPLLEEMSKLQPENEQESDRQGMVTVLGRKTPGPGTQVLGFCGHHCYHCCWAKENAQKASAKDGGDSHACLCPPGTLVSPFMALLEVSFAL